MDTSEKLIGRFTDGDKQVVVEYLEKGRDGKLIWLQKTVLMSRSTWYDNVKQEARGVIHGIILFKNTSVFHEKEQQEKERLQMAFEEADSASRAKTEFMNRMSHDIRTPINGIMGMVDITRKYRNDPQKLEECLDKIQLSSRHLQELINDVLDMSKLESGQTVLEEVPFDLAILMNEVSSLVNAQLIQGGLTHRTHRENMQHLKLIGSPLHLRQIMLNLFSNAIKYNKPDGTIEVSSVKGEGSTFVFRIPFKLDQAACEKSEQKQKNTGSELRLKGFHVLLVEDNDINMEIAQFYLEENGATIEQAWNGQEAVDKIKASAPGTFDTVLMDIMMPVMDGLEATRQIRRWEKQYDRHTPIIAMTAKTSSDTAQECRDAGMDDHIAKPVDPGILVSRVL